MSRRALVSHEEDEFEEEEVMRVSSKRAVDADEKDDDDEEEEEGHDEYEQDGFIVDDNEEMDDEEEERVDRNEERHKRRRKKRDSQKSYVLDEDDYVLLQDNNITGFQRQKPENKFKRLKKTGRDSEIEDRPVFFVEGNSNKTMEDARTAEEKLKRTLFGDDEAAPLEDIAEDEEQQQEEGDADIIGEEEEDDLADFIVDEEDGDETGVGRKKKLKKKKLRQAPVFSSSTLQEAHAIFGNAAELIEIRKQSMAKEEPSDVVDLSKKFQNEFEPFILAEKYMTEEDERIRETDVPERIQISEILTGPPPTDDRSIEEESAWIYDQLASGSMSPFVGEDLAREISKEEIGNVLTLLHVQKMDIPFIAMYRKELCGTLLKADPEHDTADGEERTSKMKWHKALWAVYTLDRKWLLLEKRKSALKIYYTKRFAELAHRIDEETRLALNQQLFKSITEALKDAKSEREVDDVDAKHNLHFLPGEGDVAEGQFKRPKRKSLYSVCYKAGLWEIASKFGLNSEQFGKILALEKVSFDELQDGKEIPEEIAGNFTCAMFESPSDVLKGARHMAAVEIGCEPIVKKHVRAIFMEKAVISVSPTSEGNSVVDVYHPLSGMKWLRNKPISMFKDAKWLLIQKAEEEKLLQVTIKLPEDVQKKLLDDANQYYLSECVSKSAQLWNEQRKMILEDSFFNFILPSMEKEARALLTTRAKNWVLVEYGKQLWSKVSVAPFHRKDAEADSLDEYESRVMACCWGPGKPATTMVMLDTAGEIVDVLYAGSISIRHQGVSEQQRKKNDQQRVLKFLTDHQPHAVCVGAANLSCIMLKDDIYEVIFKIVEDHPRDVSRDMENISIVFGDESLPRLYEISRVASDQLPGQQDIVRRAVALGRYLQNPLAMIATLCGPGKEILSWKLYSLEHFLTSDEKYEIVEQVMVDATNQIGLDINLAASHEWLFAPLQFVSGLGPRKASGLQRVFVRSCSIFNRKDLFTVGKHVKKKVFMSCVGFFRIRRSGSAASSGRIFDLLDDTRIHPESYELAKNLAKEVYAADITQDPNDIDDDDAQEMAVEHVRKRPNMLKALDIDEYAKSIFEQFDTQKKDTLRDIKFELLHGFQDCRIPFREPNPDEEFVMLSGETEDTIAVDRVVQVTVRNVQESRVICTFDSGLKGIISADDFSDDGFDAEKVKEGDILTCKIRNFNKNRFIVNLTCKESDIRGRSNFNRDLDPFYQEDEINVHGEKDKARRVKELAKKHFKHRMVIHPRFQNFSADEAMEYLSEKDSGESIFRPSSKGPSFLTLTVKIYDGVYAHKDIAEGGKDHKDITSILRLGKTLTIDKDTFEDLDEVMDRYVDPMVTILKTMLAHRIFRTGTKAEVDDLLRAEKAKNPMRIVYGFSISHEHPGTFILSYIRTSNPHHEYIGLYPKGFRFRRKDFDNIDKLIAYFQRNIDKPPDSSISLRTVAAMVPMQNSSFGDFSSDSGAGNDERRMGGRYGEREGHQGRGRGRGRGRRGTGRGNEDRDSDFGFGGWSFQKNDDNGPSSFLGAKVQNSPGSWRCGDGGGGSGDWCSGGGGFHCSEDKGTQSGRWGGGDVGNDSGRRNESGGWGGVGGGGNENGGGDKGDGWGTSGDGDKGGGWGTNGGGAKNGGWGTSGGVDKGGGWGTSGGGDKGGGWGASGGGGRSNWGDDAPSKSPGGFGSGGSDWGGSTKRLLQSEAAETGGGWSCGGGGGGLTGGRYGEREGHQGRGRGRGHGRRGRGRGNDGLDSDFGSGGWSSQKDNDDGLSSGGGGGGRFQDSEDKGSLSGRWGGGDGGNNSGLRNSETDGWSGGGGGWGGASNDARSGGGGDRGGCWGTSGGGDKGGGWGSNGGGGGNWGDEAPSKSPGGFSSGASDWGGSSKRLPQFEAAETGGGWSSGGCGGGGRYGEREGHRGRGRGRGRRGRGRGNDDYFGSGGWSSQKDNYNGLSSFPGPRVPNSPGREVLSDGWGGSGGSGGWSSGGGGGCRFQGSEDKGSPSGRWGGGDVGNDSGRRNSESDGWSGGGRGNGNGGGWGKASNDARSGGGDRGGGWGTSGNGGRNNWGDEAPSKSPGGFDSGVSDWDGPKKRLPQSQAAETGDSWSSGGGGGGGW